MNKQRIFSLLLAAVMLFSLAIPGAAFAADEGTDIDSQLTLIFSQIDQLLQKNGELTWYYTVSDLDHNGCLEFIAAAQHPQDRSTNLRIWEVSKDRNSLLECGVNKEAEESFPDILTDSCDTFHDTASDSWFYLFYDNVILSANEVYTSKSAYRLKDGVIGYLAYAVEHTVVENGYRNVSHMNQSGVSISPEEYNAAGVNAFAGTERSSTNFDWFTVDEANSLSRLTDSFLVFTGRKNAPRTFPVPKPVALDKPLAPDATATPAPTAAPAPNPQPTYLSVTKNPTNENRKEGDTAYFVSCANAYESLSWTMVSPNGGEYSVQNFAAMFPNSPISGQMSTTLTIAKTTADMNNWGAYCTFYYKGQTARTSTAYMYISSKQQQKSAASGTYYGTVTDWSFSTVTVSIPGQVNAVIPWGLCDVDGDLYYGASASVYFDGKNVTYCYIKGEQMVGPVYGTMSGTIYSDSAYTVYVVLQNGVGLHLNAGLVNWVSGNTMDGASCTVYYVNYASEDNVYQIDVYGYNSYEPNYGSMGGTAYSGGGGYAINLYNGSQVYVDGWKCSVSGSFYEGCSCTVYYIDSPSSDNIYSVEIYGTYDQGGWAGSNYYENEYGGWDGSNYYDYYPDDWYVSDYGDWSYIGDQGGWAGANYYDFVY